MDRIAQELQIWVIVLAQKQKAPNDYEHGNPSDDVEPLIHYLLQFGQ